MLIHRSFSNLKDSEFLIFVIIFTVFKSLPVPLASIRILHHDRSPTHLLRDFESLTYQIFHLISCISLTDSSINFVSSEKCLLTLLIVSWHRSWCESRKVYEFLLCLIEYHTDIDLERSIRSFLLTELRLFRNVHCVSLKECCASEYWIHTFEFLKCNDTHWWSQLKVCRSSHNRNDLWNPHSNTVKQVLMSGDSSLISTHLPPSSCRFIYRLIWKTHVLSLRVRHIYSGIRSHLDFEIQYIFK